MNKSLDAWLKAGFAVVRTDYQGLGTPGTHEYLVGQDEGHSVLDIVRAARQVDSTLGKRVIIGGHSQGGHAALWAAALAPKWTPELDVARHRGGGACLARRAAGQPDRQPQHALARPQRGGHR